MKKNDTHALSTIDLAKLTIILEQLASQASLSSLVAAGGPALPNGWVLLDMINVKVPQYVPVQGFLASGPADDSGTQVAVLALGMTWPNYMVYQVDGTCLQGPIPAVVGGSKMPSDAQFLSTYVSAYYNAQTNVKVRPAVWDSLQYLKNLPLYVCGMGLGGPLAQLVALDLRPGNTGPSGQDAPSVQSPCYVFSTPDVANQSFATYYRIAVPSTILWAGNNLLTVDQFPTAPYDGVNFTPSGTVRSITSYIPPMDDPWLERSDVYYLSALGGSPAAVTAVPGSVTSPPGGYSQDTAYMLAMLTAAAYRLTQHPQSLVLTDPFTLVNVVNSMGVPFAFVFQSNDTVVVAFRGCTTYAEFNGFTSYTDFGTPAFDPNNTAHVHGGAYSIYSSPVTAGTTTPLFSQALNAILQSVAKGKNLYLTGHSLGGTLANLAAADYAMSSAPITVNAVYTFGSILVGDFQFAQDFNTAVTAGSYQVVRTADKIYNSIAALGYEPVNGQVILNGNLAIEESTFHSLYGYAGLINPAGPPLTF